jgi:hypothetical protein
MGARFIASTIDDTRGISKKTVSSDTKFSFDMETLGNTRNYTVYVPTRKDYEVSVEVVDRARQMNCNVIVYDSWIFSTSSGYEYAKSKEIPVLTVKQFIKKVKSGERLEE